MRVLDVDLDCFLDDIVTFAPEGTRPSLEDARPWEPERVARFLEQQCGLSADQPLSSRLVSTHDQVLDLWREQLAAGDLIAPLDVVHVDAHPDLGLGDTAYAHICREVLHLPVEQRQYPSREGWSGLSEGNYLLYAISFRWIGSLTHVFAPGGSGNVPLVVFRGRRTSSGVVELPCFPKGTDLNDGRLRPMRVEPAVPYREVSVDQYQNGSAFDFGYLSISPRYTPAEAETLVETIGRYMRFD